MLSCTDEGHITHTRHGRTVPLITLTHLDRVKAATLLYSPALSLLLASGALATQDGARAVARQWRLTQ